MSKAQNEQFFKIAGTAVAAFFTYKIVIKPLLTGLGLQKSDAEIENENAQLNETAWSPTFYENAPIGAILKTSAFVDQQAEVIYNSLTWYNDNFDAILGAIRSFKTKTQLSQLSAKFLEKYQLDMYSYLTNGNSGVSWAGGGLSTDHLNILNKYAQNLPNY